MNLSRGNVRWRLAAWHARCGRPAEAIAELQGCDEAWRSFPGLALELLIRLDRLDVALERMHTSGGLDEALRIVAETDVPRALEHANRFTAWRSRAAALGAILRSNGDLVTHRSSLLAAIQELGDQDHARYTRLYLLARLGERIATAVPDEAAAIADAQIAGETLDWHRIHAIVRVLPIHVALGRAEQWRPLLEEASEFARVNEDDVDGSTDALIADLRAIWRRVAPEVDHRLPGLTKPHRAATLAIERALSAPDVERQIQRTLDTYRGPLRDTILVKLGGKVAREPSGLSHRLVEIVDGIDDLHQKVELLHQIAESLPDDPRDAIGSATWARARALPVGDRSLPLIYRNAALGAIAGARVRWGSADAALADALTAPGIATALSLMEMGLEAAVQRDPRAYDWLRSAQAQIPEGDRYVPHQFAHELVSRALVFVPEPSRVQPERSP